MSALGDRLRSRFFPKNNSSFRTKKGKRFLVACFPKSGSTFLTDLISDLPGFERCNYVPAFGRREQELCEAKLLEAAAFPYQIAQCHVRASDHTTFLMEKFDLDPIVLVRNIYDVIVSVADHLKRESTVSPLAYFEERLVDLPMAQRLDAVVDLVLPWYFNFYVSWWHSRPEAFVSYEDLILGGPRRQLEFLRGKGIDVSLDTVLAAVEKGRQPGRNTRLNVGEAGRGAELVKSQHGPKVERLASYYPDVDFTLMGLDRRPSGDRPAGLQ